MKQYYLLKKAEYYFQDQNYRRCLESCINIFSYENLTVQILFNLNSIIQKFVLIEINPIYIGEYEIETFEDFLDLCKGSNEEKYFYSLFLLHYCYFLAKYKIRSMNYIITLLKKAVLNTNCYFLQLYALFIILHLK